MDSYDSWAIVFSLMARRAEAGSRPGPSLKKLGEAISPKKPGEKMKVK